MKGFVKVTIFKREFENGTRVLIVTTWADMEAIKQFAGEDAPVAVVPANVQQMMVACDAMVARYEIAAMYIK